VIGFVNATIVIESHSLLQPFKFARVGSVSIAANSRHRGIGRQLMSMVEHWAAAQGASDVRLNVWAFNGPARHLYEELGYEVRSLLMGKALRQHEA
jgi:ribosomal protein S18 acetylase RimI-like enzyme